MIPTVVLGFTGAAFIGFGLAFAFWPAAMAQLVEIRLGTPTARTDFAATYGGFELGVGAFLLLCVRRPAWREAGLWAGALSLGGFAAVRTLSLAAYAPVRPVIYVALALELAGTLLNLWALRAVRL